MDEPLPSTPGAGVQPARTIGTSARPRGDVRTGTDAGITLVEIIMSVVLSSIIGAVIVATLTTSMNAADSASSSVASSVDTQLITTFLTADAQAAGGIDPITAALDPNLGVSTVGDVAGWAGCTQPGTLAVRFAWKDRSASGTDTVAVTYALQPDGTLVRRTCDGSGTSQATLGRRVTSVTVTCSPTLACTGLPSQVNVRLQGGDSAAPFDVTLAASLRPQIQSAPDLTNSAQAPLVVTGSTTCPVLSVGAAVSATVLGDAIVDSGCGASPISGVLTSLGISGSLSLLGTVDDPLATVAPPTSCAGVTGSNPTIGSSSGASANTVYPNAVTITGAATFQPGRHVFCNGLTIASGATVQGTGVLLYVASGAVSVSSGSVVTLAPATSGTYAGTVLWSAGTQPVTIDGGAAVDQFSGVVYVPRASLTVTAVSGVRLGAVVADRLTVGGTGPVRIGVPIPDLTVAAATLPSATVGQLYSATAPGVSGGTAPVRYSATGLPAGLVMSSSGAITGVPLAVGSFDVSFLAVDATGASVVFQRTISVSGTPPAPTDVTAAAGDTTAAVSWTPGTAVGAPATTGYTVTATATGFTTRTCTGGSSATSCNLTGLTNGVTYTVTVTATNSVGTSAAGVTTVTPRPAVLVGSGAQLWLDATDPDADGTAEGASEQCNASTTCTAASNVMTRWEDKSGANNDATQSTASMAGSYVPLMPAVNFDANGWYEATVNSGPDMTAFVVAQSDTSTWNTYGWLLASRRPNGVIMHPWPGGSAVGWFATNSAGGYLSEAQATVGTITSPHVYDHTQTGSNPIVGTSSLDGSTFSTLTFTGQTRTATSVVLRLGADDMSGRLGNGKYREVLVFSRSLTAAERRTVQEYLARKWAIAITPGAPTGVSALAADSGALVSWTAPAWNGGSAVTSYRVTAWPGGATCTAAASATSCAVTGLTNGTAYSFFVEAFNAVGTGAQSAASNTITPGPPPAPTSPVATFGSRQVTVSWTAPTLNGHAPLTGYTVTATAAGQTTRTCTTTPPTTSCTVTGLVNDVAYAFAVTAANAHGNSPATTTTATPTWTPSALGSALTWWFDASVSSDLTGSWVTQSGFTVSGTAGSTRIRASSGVVERVDVLNGGSGYTSSPTLSISGGGGSGAYAADLTVTSGAVSLPNLYVRGSGYTSEPTVTSSGGGGTGAQFRARITVPVAVGTTIRIAGQSYTVTDRDGLTLTISPALAATATAASIEEWQVSVWRNRGSGTTLDARQTTTSRQPALGTMAGRTAVVFTGIDQLMTLLDGTGGTFDKGLNWTAVVAYQADRQLSWGAVGQPWNAANTRIFTSTGGGIADWQSGQNIEMIPAVGSDSITGGPVRVGVDSGNGIDTLDWNIVSIGSLSQPTYTDGWSFSGAIGEIIFVNAGLDSTAVADAQAYLAAKWSQANSLPSAPINLTATPGDGQAVIEWRAANPYLTTISGYTVTATATGQTTRTCTTTTALTCTLTGLTNGAPYTVSVTATSAVGTGAASVPVTVVTRPALLTSTNSRVWLDGADLDGDGWIEGGAAENTVVSGAVQTWTDKSGRSNSTTAPSTAERPTSTAQTMNGLPVVTFNGTTILQGTSASNPYSITGDRTMFVVTRRRSGSPSRLVDRVPEDTPLFSINGSNQLEVRTDANSSYQVFGNVGSTANAVTVLTANRSGNALGIWSNGALSGSSTISGTQTMRALTIGRHIAFGQSSDFDIAEVILFDRALTVAEIRTVEEYLRQKWGVTLVPDQPTGATASRSGSAVTVTWTAPANTGGSAITGYTVTASNGTTCTSTTTSCTFSSLPSPATYTFTVTATNAVGTSRSSAASNSLTLSAVQTATITTAGPWNGLAVGNFLWVTNDSANSVSKIDMTTNTVVATVPVGSRPTSLAFDGTNVWVTNTNSGNVTKINATTNAVAATVTTGAGAWGVAFDGTNIWVANRDADSLSKINPTTNAIIATISTQQPTEIIFAHGTLWVPRANGSRVFRIDVSTNNVITNINTGSTPYSLTSDGTSVWVVNRGDNNVSRINPSTNNVTATISVGANPYGVAALNGRVYVTNMAANTMSTIDPTTNSVVSTVATGTTPYGVVAASGSLWVMNWGSNSVWRYAP